MILMDRRDIVIKTIRGEETEYTPYHFDLTMKITDRLGEHYGLDRDEVEDFIGNHFLYLSFGGPDGAGSGYRDNAGGMNTAGDEACRGTGKGEIFRDEFGVAWDASGNYDIGDWGLVDNAVKGLDFSGYTFPDGKGEGRFGKAVETMEKYPGRLNVMMVKGPFVQGWEITGMDDFLVGMIAEESKIKWVLENTTNYIVNIIEAIPEGVDAVRVLDDWGMQSGLLFSKEMWKKFMYPRLMEIGDAIRKRGMLFMHHSCGDTAELFPYFVDLGIDVYDPMQPEALDIAYVKRQFGKDVTLFGGLGSQSTIPMGSPADVVKEARETHALLGEGGMYVLGPAGSVPTEAPIENVVALVDYCKGYAGSG